MISCFLLLAAVSSTFRDNKPYLFHISSRACCLEKSLKQLREAKNMKPLWKVKGFEKQDIPTTADRERHTNRQTKSHSDAADARARARHDAAHHKTSTGEQNRQGDTETILTFRALHGSHTVSIPFETIVKKAT